MSEIGKTILSLISTIIGQIKNLFNIWNAKEIDKLRDLCGRSDISLIDLCHTLERSPKSVLQQVFKSKVVMSPKAPSERTKDVGDGILSEPITQFHWGLPSYSINRMFSFKSIRKKKRVRREKLPPEKEGYYQVWYATNRRKAMFGKSKVRFLNEWDENVHYGKCLVYIPKSHKPGHVGPAHLWEKTTGRGHLSISDRLTMTVGEFCKDINANLSALPPVDANSALVFFAWFQCLF